MSGAWHYKAGADSKGPFTTEQMAGFVSAGMIDAHTQVWSETIDKWEPLYRTELRSLLGDAQIRPPSGLAPVAAGDQGAPRPVGFGEAVSLFFSKYATFSGRASRSEYWFAVLFLVIAGIVTVVIDLAIFGAQSNLSPVSSLWQLAVLVPSLSISVRRLHDTDRSGWTYLLILIPIVGAIVLLVFFCQRGTPSTNRFG